MLYQNPQIRARSLHHREGRRLVARLSPTMACDTAFRVIARRYLRDLVANHRGACDGDPGAVHEARIALTRLRTTIFLFSPMVADVNYDRIRRELKWLNAHLGAVRDLDVAIERLTRVAPPDTQAAAYHATVMQKRKEKLRALSRALRSSRYGQLLKLTSDWIEHGPWSNDMGEEATRERALEIAEYGASKLVRWKKRVLKKSRKLRGMSIEKRHRLRLLNKKLTYALDTFDDLFSDERFSEKQLWLKHLRRAQKSLGQLNDDARGHELATTLQGHGSRAPFQLIGIKREKRLLRNAATAYRKLADLNE